MEKNELIMAVEQVCEEKNISFDAVMDSVEAALAVAYRKEYGDKTMNCRAEYNLDDGNIRVFDVKTVVEEPQEEAVELEEGEELDPEAPTVILTVEGEDGERRRYNPRIDITLEEARLEKDDAEIGDEIIKELPQPEGFGRVAAQTAKQVIIQKLREAERNTLFDEYKDRVGEIVNATVQRVEGPMVFMDLGQATAIMPPSEQVRSETYKVGDRYKVFLQSVDQGRRGPEILASRSAGEMVVELFTMEVPEITAGTIEVKGVAREGGSRTKIAVEAMDENIDPIGSCVGQRGARVQAVMGELAGEKIDIIEYSEDPVEYLENALSPAKVVRIELNEEEQTATAYVEEDQLSLAIGKGGQNVRLAAKLTGWKIDVVQSDAPASDDDSDDAEEATSEEMTTEEATTEATTTEETVVEAVEEATQAEEVETQEEVEEETDDSSEESTEDEN